MLDVKLKQFSLYKINVVNLEIMVLLRVTDKELGGDHMSHLNH